MATKKKTNPAEAAQSALARIASGKTTINRERLRLVPDVTNAPWLKALQQAAGGEKEWKALLAERPKALAPVATVWDIADSMPDAERSEIIEVCIKAGVNPATAQTQYGLWRAMTDGENWAYDAIKPKVAAKKKTTKAAAKKSTKKSSKARSK